jgi:hypothetical protein
MRNTPKRPGIQVTPISSSTPDGPGIKNPTYKGKNPSDDASDIPIRALPVGGFKPVKTGGGNSAGSRGGGFGAGGRFGRGGWRSSGQNMKNNFLEKTAAQKAESEEKKRRMELKRKAAKTRITAAKTGPNEKQNQLLGGE